jgi:hypothetical protein
MEHSIDPALGPLNGIDSFSLSVCTYFTNLYMFVPDINIEATPTHKASHPLKLNSNTKNHQKKRTKSPRKQQQWNHLYQPRITYHWTRIMHYCQRRNYYPHRRTHPMVRNHEPPVNTNLVDKEMASSKGGGIPAKMIFPIPGRNNGPAKNQVEKIMPRKKEKNSCRRLPLVNLIQNCLQQKLIKRTRMCNCASLGLRFPKTLQTQLTSTA